MLVVDAQIHLWGADTPERPWPPGAAARAQKPYPVGKDMALAGMKEAGVDRAVIVPPSWEGERNDLALEAARLHPDRFAVMGRFPLEKPESRGLVDGWRKQPGMLGMRFTFHNEHYRHFLTDGTADVGIEVTARLPAAGGCDRAGKAVVRLDGALRMGPR